MKKNIFENHKPIADLSPQRAEYDIEPELIEHKDILDHKESDKPFLRLFYLACSLFVIIILFKLINIQITHGYENRFLAEDNRIRLRKIEPPRGIISDSLGQSLVSNTPSYQLIVYPFDLPKKQKERLAIYKKISNLTAISSTEFNKVETQGIGTLEPVVIREDIDRDTAIAWDCKLSDMSGVAISKATKRVYSPISGLSHILGYVGRISEIELDNNPLDYENPSKIGKTGLEKFYEQQLRGKTGQEELEVDSKYRVQRTLSRKAPISGNNLILSLDSRLQNAASAALQQAFIDNKTEKGVAVAMNPKDGSILAMISLPDYNNNLFARGITQQEYTSLLQDKNRPMLDRSISGTYPSGSVIKPIIASIALQEKIITPNTKIDTSAGAIKIGQWIFPDWKVHGTVEVRQAISESNDMFFYTLGGGYQNIKGLGIEKMSEWLKKFGLGSPTGIDLPNEASGLVPDDPWKRRVKKEPWYLGDTYHLSIGQGYFLASPLQIAVATSVIANDGDLIKPHLVSKVVDNNGNIIQKIESQKIKENLIDKQYLKVVREGMRLAVTSGPAFKLRDLPFTTAAKTGTAEFGDNTFSHAWFTAFAPYENPEIVVAVMIEGGGHGSLTSAPVARKILETYFANKK